MGGSFGTIAVFDQELASRSAGAGRTSALVLANARAAVLTEIGLTFAFDASVWEFSSW